jgi:DNA transposition AAA+ family ATPase
MIAEGTEASAVTAEQVQQVAADVELFTRTHKIHRRDVAKAIGYSPGVVSEFLKGSYAGNAAAVAIDLESWLVEEEQRRARPTTTQFVWTNVALAIKATVHYCIDYRSIGLVYGPDSSGIGKTTALRAIRQELGPRRCSLVTIDKVDANPTNLLKKLCVAIGTNDSGSNKQRFDRLVEKLTGRSHIMLIDQAHNLRWSKNDKPFYHLTDLFDATNAAQLWCGTADLVAYLQRQQTRNADESLAQINRRIYPRKDLMEFARTTAGGGGPGEPLVTVQQVREMFAKNKLRLTDSAARFLCRVCNQPESGSVGLCVRLVEFATMLGDISRVKTIDVAMLQEAMRHGLSLVGADQLLHRMEIEPEPMTATAKVG